MSTHIKVNVAVATAVLTVVISALWTALYISQLAGAKVNDIDVAKQDIGALRVDMQSVIKITERLDERSKTTERFMDSLDSKLDSKLQGIASQLGLARSEIRQAHEN